MSDEYSEEEKEQIRSQLREGNRLAREVAVRRGVKVHPRVLFIKGWITDCYARGDRPDFGFPKEPGLPPDR